MREFLSSVHGYRGWLCPETHSRDAKRPTGHFHAGRGNELNVTRHVPLVTFIIKVGFRCTQPNRGYAAGANFPIADMGLRNVECGMKNQKSQNVTRHSPRVTRHF